jgi:zinc transporter
MEEELADLEYRAATTPRRTFDRLRVLHRRAASIRRGKMRERDAMAQIAADAPPWLAGPRQDEWAQLAKRTGDQVALLDAAVERCHGLYEYVQGLLATVLNDRLYVLTVISAIMLPLSFITGLLGVNVAGVPGEEAPWAFVALLLALCLFLALLGLAQFYLARKLKWIPRRPRQRHA